MSLLARADRALGYTLALMLGVLCMLGCGASADDVDRQRTELTAAEQATPAQRDAALRAAFVSSQQRQADPSYAFASRAGGLNAHNRAQHLRLSIEPERVHASALDDSWALSLWLSGYGRPGALSPAPAVERLQSSGNEASYQRQSGIREWYLNGPLGLEQGVTLPAPPDGEGPLLVEVRFAQVQPLARDGAHIDLVSPSGARLRYAELYAHDDDGRALPAWMRVAGQTVQLLVDDTEARYPVTIDPLVAVAHDKLTAMDGTGADELGYAVAISGDTVVLGAKEDDSGSIYVFIDENGGWLQQAKLIAADGLGGDELGYSLAIDGDTIVAGARMAGPAGPSSGAAYVFVRNGTSWSEQAKLIPNDSFANELFGESVSISGDTIIVGAQFDQVNGTSSGSAYAFVRNGSSWSQQAKLVPNDGMAFMRFGYSVGVSGDTAVIGTFNDTGAAYVFQRQGNAWTQHQKLSASDGAGFDLFGCAVSITGDTAVIGAWGDDGIQLNAGSAYVFRRHDDAWLEQQKLIASDTAYEERFGRAVSISDDRLIIGAHPFMSTLPSLDATSSGAAYLFMRRDGQWIEQQKLTSQTPDFDWFGRSVGIDGDRAIISAAGDSEVAMHAGAAHAYELVDAPAAPCTTAAQCPTGHCVDGLCCNSGCTDLCMACDIAGSDGLCSPIGAGDDPDDECPGGACDGSGACGLDNGLSCVAGGECASGHCVDGVCCDEACSGDCETCTAPDSGGICSLLPQGSAGEPACEAPLVCDGLSPLCPDGCSDDMQCADGWRCDTATGACFELPLCNGSILTHPDGSVTSCGPYVCSAEGECLQQCSADGECSPGFRCTGGNCVRVPTLDDEGGCGCHMIRARSEHPAHWLWALGLLLITLRRSRSH